MITYRLARGEDIEKVKKISEGDGGQQEYSWNIWWYLLHSSAIYVALDIGRVVGYAAIMDGSNPYLFSIAVIPSYRRKGIATTLISLLLEKEKKKMIDTLP